MRCRIYPGGAVANIGDTRYEVEWQEMTPSALKRQAAEEARTRARAVVDARNTAFGSATVTKQVVEWLSRRDGVGEWNDVGDHEYVD